MKEKQKIFHHEDHTGIKRILYFSLAVLLKNWSRTLRYQRVNYPQILEEKKKGPVIFSIWHNELFAPIGLHKGEKITAVVSPSKDGELVAHVLSRLGYTLARGSSSRGGLRAVRSALDQMQQGRDVVFTVDGPKGPRHEVKPGIIYLASKSGAPIVPVRVKVSRAKVFSRSWDKFILPLPGAKCVLHYKTPYLVPKQRPDSEFLQKETHKLQEKMKDF